ncbi:MAG: hypothetical protein ACYTEL_04905 [Planctomycetota bacterium]|jgi:hypothetical protein
MRRQDILRSLLFVVFFGIGAAAVAGAVLCDELFTHYRNKHQLQVQKHLTERLKSLNADYDALLEQLRRDPNLVERLGPAVLGTGRRDPNTVYPKVTPQQLEAARQVLMDESKLPTSPAVPAWLDRTSKPPQRIALFLAGSFLILISFIWFGSGRRDTANAT